MGGLVETSMRRPELTVRVATEAEDLAAQHRPAHGQYLAFLKSEPSADTARAVEALPGEGERFLVRGRVVHMLYDVPYGTSKSAPLIEKKAGPGTNRNLTVVRTLAEKWGA